MLLHLALQREEEAARKRQIEQEFAMMEVRALMDSGLIPSRSRRAGSSRGSVDGSPFDPAAQERARLHAERAAASVAGGGARHFRRRSTTSEMGDPVQPVIPRQRTVSEDGIFLERGRSAQNGGIPAAATLAGLQQASPQPSLTTSPSRGRAEPSPRASPPTTPSRVPSGTYAPAAAQRQPSPRSPLTFGAGASPRSVAVAEPEHRVGHRPESGERLDGCSGHHERWQADRRRQPTLHGGCRGQQHISDRLRGQRTAGRAVRAVHPG
jgi:hypothetical protein